ncbi:MAG: FliM/FliN family flagellar motor switch protein [Actinomycetota bacterium]|nr:FliM/FliN family flagellar motor switch protein [Actinomycetota bacterium]
MNTPPAAASSEKFDFRRQKTLERAYLRSVELLLESYCKPAASTLTGSLRQNCKVELREIVQNPWESLSHPESYSPVVFSLPPLPSRGIMIMPVPMALLMVELKLGGNGHRIPRRSSLTEIEAVLLKELTNELLARMAVAFSHATELHADWQGAEQSRQIVQRLPGNEMYLYATFDIAIGDIAENFQLSFAFPFTMLIPLLESFNVRSEGVGVTDSRNFRESMRARMLDVPVSIEARFKSTTLSYGEVMAIEPGAVLSLGHSRSEPIELRVGGVVLHKAQPTRIGKRVAAMIVKE